MPANKNPVHLFLLSFVCILNKSLTTVIFWHQSYPLYPSCPFNISMGLNPLSTLLPFCAAPRLGFLKGLDSHTRTILSKCKSRITLSRELSNLTSCLVSFGEHLRWKGVKQTF